MCLPEASVTNTVLWFDDPQIQAEPCPGPWRGIVAQLGSAPKAHLTSSPSDQRSPG